VDDNSGLEVYISVPVQQTSRLRIGLPVRLVDETGQVLASERVSFVSASVDENTQTVLAKAPLSDRQGTFRSEQFVRAQVVWTSEPTLTIPSMAVTRVSGQHFVFVAEPGEGGALVARQRGVTVGPMVGQDYIVRGGLKAGERVIVSGIQTIGDGVPVQALPPAAGPASPGGPAGSAAEGR
jgi:RND family efflux transporter MFP subunit